MIIYDRIHKFELYCKILFPNLRSQGWPEGGVKGVKFAHVDFSYKNMPLTLLRQILRPSLYEAYKDLKLDFLEIWYN